MKVILTKDENCNPSFEKSDGSPFLFPGQDFDPPNDYLEENKCQGVYDGPDIVVDMGCNPSCPVSGSEVYVLIADEDTGVPIAGAQMVVSLKGVGILTGTSDANGVIRFNVPYESYTYTAKKAGYHDVTSGHLTVNGCVSHNVVMKKLPPPPVLEPRNVLGFLTQEAVDGIPGRFPLAAFFNVTLTPPFPTGYADVTRWRLRTDACGYNAYYYDGDMDDNGHLLTTGIPQGISTNGEFDPVTKDFVSYLSHKEGMWLQIGVLIEGTMTWLDYPCIPGGDLGP